MEIILTTSSGNMKERKKAFIIKYFNNKAGERGKKLSNSSNSSKFTA